MFDLNLDYFNVIEPFLFIKCCLDLSIKRNSCQIQGIFIFNLYFILQIDIFIVNYFYLLTFHVTLI